MKLVRAWVRIFFLVAMISAQLLSSGVIALITPELPLRRARRVKFTSLLSRLILRFFKIKVVLENFEQIPSCERAHLIVCNHLSYIDIWVIASILPASFVTSVEMENTFLGPIAAAGGSVFVERRSASRLLKEIKSAASILKAGINLVVFPEATSSNGEQVLPFKRGFLEAALHSQNNILPLCLNYSLPQKKNFDPLTRDSIFYYGDMKFVEHFWRFVHLDGFEVRLTALPELSVAPALCTRQLSQIIFSRIAEHFLPINV